MANVAVQKRPDTSVQPAQRAWDPFQTMRDLMRWDWMRLDPFAELAPQWKTDEAGFTPAFDVKETANAFPIHADLPGMKPEDLDVKITENRLSIEGKREAKKSEKGERFYTYERTFGSFTRSFTLPAGVAADKIDAQLSEGVLSITIPKKPEVQPKQVDVKAK